MSKPKIHLSDRLQETIASHQECDCAGARERVTTIDGWMTTLLSGHFIQGDSDADTLKLLRILSDMKQDYQSLIIE